MSSFVGLKEEDLEGMETDERTRAILKQLMPQVRGPEGIRRRMQQLPDYALYIEEESERARQAEFDEEDARGRTPEQRKYIRSKKKMSKDIGVTDPGDWLSMFLRGRFKEYFELQEENPNNSMSDLIRGLRRLNETLQKYHPTQGERLDTEGGKVKVGTR
jgi:hypothetical protein